MTNNIIRGNVRDSVPGDWSNAAARATGNIVDNTGTQVTPAWFTDHALGNLHLTDQPAAAVDQATVLPEVPEDFDTGSRPCGPAPDMGADEFGWPIPGDANLDGTVGIADLGALADHYGQGAGGTPAVPEPACAALMLAGVAALVLRRARPSAK
ncbi:MAG: hypothetical protein B1H04_02015 [Planctomycetales bacterium 4484_123]|nr:MAG: hypothetical protein B1H04_02015 [Planctomycetales bacterium 4484_123]